MRLWPLTLLPPRSVWLVIALLAFGACSASTDSVPGADALAGDATDTTEAVVLSPMEELVALCEESPTLPDSGYRGLVSDIHVHVPPNVDSVEWSIALLREMNANGIGRVVTQPIHSPEGDGTWLRDVDEAMGAISAVCPRIITLVYGFNPADPEAWRYVESQLDTGRFGGVGELALAVSWRPFQIDPNNPTMEWIYDRLNSTGGVLHLQSDANTMQMRTIIETHPNVNFIWFGGCAQALDTWGVDNLYCSTFPDPSNIDPSRLLYGSDAGPKEFWPGHPSLSYDGVGAAGARIRTLLENLPTADADRIAHGNLDRIFPL